MTVIVLGASSQIGVFLLPRLLEAGYSVMAVSRKAPVGGSQVNPRLRWIRDCADLGGETDRVNALVSCGPLALLLPWQAELPALTRCVAFSSSSVLTKNLPAIDELRDAEARVRDVLARRQVPLCLLRPTLIYGCGLDRNVSLLESFGRKTGFIPVSTLANGLRQPVHADDLSIAAVNAVQAEIPLAWVGEISGGSTLSYREMAEAVAAAGARRIRVLPIPPALFSALLRVLRRSRRWRSLEPGMISRQAENLVFDDRETRDLLGLAPRRFRPVAEDFVIPPWARPYQLPSH